MKLSTPKPKTKTPLKPGGISQTASKAGFKDFDYSSLQKDKIKQKTKLNNGIRDMFKQSLEK